MSTYSNFRAMRALIKANLQVIVKSPSSVIFTIAFPMVFILVFGIIRGDRGFSMTVASAPGADTTNQLYKTLRKISILQWAKTSDSAGINKLLKEGDIVATINIQPQPFIHGERYNIKLNTIASKQAQAYQLESLITSIVQTMDPEIKKRQDSLATIQVAMVDAKEYKSIDFILPGQLSFSLLASAVFGTAFVFYNMRQTLMLKRFFATPVKRWVIVTSEGISRMLFQILGSIVIISIGHLALGFTLANGFITFINMLIVCAIGLLTFMGFGFIISSIAKSESSIPPISNIVVMPQFLLAGTFFSIDNFPKWLQPLCKIMPVTYLNDALRKISFDGASLWTVRYDLLILILWGALLYIIASKVFKWE